MHILQSNRRAASQHTPYLRLQGLHHCLPVLGVDGVLPLVAQRQDDLARWMGERSSNDLLAATNKPG